MSGAGLGSADPLPTSAPQLSQNVLLGEISFPQCGQLSATSVPQPPQNLACIRFSKPHVEHRMLSFPRQPVVGFTLSYRHGDSRTAHFRLTLSFVKLSRLQAACRRAF